jgi:acyl-coenzyme A thioesterase PaaI-like protein
MLTSRKSLSPRVKALGVKAFLNHYPPYRASGSRIRHISEDFREITVEINLTWKNRNLVGTLFGGSMYTAVDPIYMTMFMQNLGSDYIVWDKSATIRFLKPGHSKVVGEHRIEQADIERVRERLEKERAFDETFVVRLVDTKGQVVAEIDKVLYFSKKKQGRNQKVRGLFQRFFE